MKTIRRILFFIVMTTAVACSANQLEPTIDDQSIDVVPAVEQVEAELQFEVAEADKYAAFISQADVVFVGRVDYVTQSRLESENGRTHQIAFTIVESFVDKFNLGSGVVVTIQGESPMDQAVDLQNGTILTNQPSHHLAIGDEVIIFAREGTIKTANGESAVLMPVTKDGSSFAAIEARDIVLTQLSAQ